MNKTASSQGCPDPLILPRPSWFATQGIPRCSKWGKSEIECLAWAYVAAQARDGDTWHEITPEKCYELLTVDERSIVKGFTREGGLSGAYRDCWEMIGRQLRDADGAFEVAGLAWTRRKFNQENAQDKERKNDKCSEVKAPHPSTVAAFEAHWQEWMNYAPAHDTRFDDAFRVAFLAGCRARQKRVEWMMRELIALNPAAEAHYRVVADIPDTESSKHYPDKTP